MENTAKQIDVRYSKLAEETCCLSCGGAVNHAEPAAGEVCVDLGSGRGNDVIRMAQKAGSSGYAYGIDVSQGMLEKARKTASKMGIGNVEFVESELSSLPFKTSSIDLVISNCTINHAADKQAVWNEIHRILKPGGRFVVSDIYAISAVPEEYRRDPEAIAECWAGAVTREEYFSTLAAAGFTLADVLEESTPYEKGKINVSSFTIKGEKNGGACCCSNK